MDGGVKFHEESRAFFWVRRSGEVYTYAGGWVAGGCYNMPYARKAARNFVRENRERERRLGNGTYQA